jgi:glycine betaine/proline transport system substrate-binding protein
MKHLTLTTAMALAFALPAFANDTPGAGVTVRPMLSTQIEEHFQHRILFRALQDLGYTVAEPNEAEYQTIHLALGTGDADFTAVSWHSLHDAFYQEAGGDAVLSKVGVYIEGALQGYLVDKASYDAGVTDLGMLKDPEVAKRFDADADGKADLAGCIPGWGCERVIETALDAYELRAPSRTIRAPIRRLSPIRSHGSKAASRSSTTPGPPIGYRVLWSPAATWNG